MKLLLLLIALLVGELCLADEPTDPQKVKNGTGHGRYESDRHHSDRGYGGHREHRRHNDYGRKNYRAPIVDDYVCDLEATILVVSSKHHVKEEKPREQSYGNKGYQQEGNKGYQQEGNKGYQQEGNKGYQQEGGYGNQQGNYNQGGGNSGGSYGSNNGPYRAKRNSGYSQSPAPTYGSAPQQQYGGEASYDNKPKRHEYATPDALRLKCSHIAVHSEHDCHTCCQLSARRYHSVSKHEIFGFIIDASEINEGEKGEKSYGRPKRDADYGSQPAPAASNYQGQSQGYGQSGPAPSYSTVAPSYPTQGYSVPAASYPAPEASYPAADYPVPSYSAPTAEYEEQPKAYSSDSEYQSSSPASYSGKSHRSYGPPKDARCVCCSPKRHDHHHKRRDYDNDRSYDRSDSREY